MVSKFWLVTINTWSANLTSEYEVLQIEADFQVSRTGDVWLRPGYDSHLTIFVSRRSVFTAMGLKCCS